MTHEEIKDYICECGYEDTVIFENPAYDSAFIGLSTDGNAVYNYELMIDDLVKEDGMDYEEAMEFIDYNTVRALPYMGNRAPIILYPCEEMTEA
jgi:hypothetical protein